MRKMIGNARMKDGLYYFGEKVFKNKQVQSFGASVSSTSTYDRIMLWNLILGHPCFSYLKHLFPGIFKRS